MVGQSPRLTLLWLPTYCPRANPIERAFGDVHDKCTRNHQRQRLRDVVQDVERHMRHNGPWKYNLSQLYQDPEVTAAVEYLALEDEPNSPRECTNLVWADLGKREVGSARPPVVRAGLRSPLRHAMICRSQQEVDPW